MNEIEKNDQALIEEEWGNYGSKERLALRDLLEAYRKNPSNGNRHEQAVVDFISDALATTREEAVRERILNWIQDPKNISVGQAGDFRDDDIVVLKRHLLQALTEHEVKEEEV